MGSDKTRLFVCNSHSLARTMRMMGMVGSEAGGGGGRVLADQCEKTSAGPGSRSTLVRPLLPKIGRLFQWSQWVFPLHARRPLSTKYTTDF